MATVFAPRNENAQRQDFLPFRGPCPGSTLCYTLLLYGRAINRGPGAVGSRTINNSARRSRRKFKSKHHQQPEELPFFQIRLCIPEVRGVVFYCRQDAPFVLKKASHQSDAWHRNIVYDLRSLIELP